MSTTHYGTSRVKALIIVFGFLAICFYVADNYHRIRNYVSGDDAGQTEMDEEADPDAPAESSP